MVELLVPLAVAHITIHPVKIGEFKDKHHTRVEACGQVTYVAHEDDKDWHFTLGDGHGNFIVCEIMPEIPMEHPKVGDQVCAEGIRRYDDETNHNWWEIHPVISWRKAK